MVIIETSIFTRQDHALMPDEEYRKLPAALIGNPQLGQILRIGQILRRRGGLRRVRRRLPGRGKSGGARVIYYWAMSEKHIYMLLMYSKVEQDDLTADQLKVLRGLVKEEYR